MSPTPGILYVTMQPHPSLPPSQFHDWYNNEHGPGRLRLPFCLNGFRYRATDLSSSTPASKDAPEWMAIYDIEDMEWLTKDVYTRLRKDPVQSKRERDTMKQIAVDRRFYDFVGESKSEGFRVLEDVGNEGEGNVLITEYTSSPLSDNNLGELRKLAGWRRTRQFVTSYLDIKDGRSKEYLTLHEFSPSSSTPSASPGSKARTYDLYYTFGPASRDLSSLISPDTVPAESTDGLTKTFPSSSSQTQHPIIESFITTPDGVQLPYRLAGAKEADAPLLVCVNSILVSRDIWEDFVMSFLEISPEYRVLTYNARGRSTLPGDSTSLVTVDTLSHDVITILDALRVKRASVVGVSLGGATALNTALKFPERIEGFVSCDTNSVAPAGNQKAWGERLEMCEAESAKSLSGEPVVGQNLAEITVRRWFVKESYADAALAEKIEQVKGMVTSNSLSGFRASVNALYEYDFRPQMKEYRGKGAFLVGAGDGVLPKTMKEMADSLGEGVELKAIEGAGHLPMVERSKEVAEFVARFLG